MKRYLLGYMPEQSKIYLIDKELNVVLLDVWPIVQGCLAFAKLSMEPILAFGSLEGDTFYPPHGIDRVPVSHHAQGEHMNSCASESRKASFPLEPLFIAYLLEDDQEQSILGCFGFIIFHHSKKQSLRRLEDFPSAETFFAQLPESGSLMGRSPCCGLPIRDLD